jgi:sulfur carrier protein ThiS
MHYRITLKGHLFLYEPNKERSTVLESRTSLTPAGMIKALGIPASELYMVAVGGKQMPLDVPLSDEQDVEIYPVIAGG